MVCPWGLSGFWGGQSPVLPSLLGVWHCVRGSRGCSAPLRSSAGTQQRVNTTPPAFSFSNLVARQNVEIYGLRLGPGPRGWLEEAVLAGSLLFGSETLQWWPVLHCCTYRRAQTTSAPPFPREKRHFWVIPAGNSSMGLSHPAPKTHRHVEKRGWHPSNRHQGSPLGTGTCTAPGHRAVMVNTGSWGGSLPNKPFPAPCTHAGWQWLAITEGPGIFPLSDARAPCRFGIKGKSSAEQIPRDARDLGERGKSDAVRPAASSCFLGKGESEERSWWTCKANSFQLLSVWQALKGSLIDCSRLPSARPPIAALRRQPSRIGDYTSCRIFQSPSSRVLFFFWFWLWQGFRVCVCARMHTCDAVPSLPAKPAPVVAVC